MAGVVFDAGPGCEQDNEIVTATLQQVQDRIDDRVDDLVELTCDLIRFPTINPPGEAYQPCAE